MISKSKIALIAALAVSVASPAFAQSFNKGDGSGNALPFAYGEGATKSASPAEAAPLAEQFSARQTGSERVAVRLNSRTRIAAGQTRGLYAYAAVPAAPQTPGLYDSAAAPFVPQTSGSANSPALTGGGSTGYNQMVLTY